MFVCCRHTNTATRRSNVIGMISVSVVLAVCRPGNRLQQGDGLGLRQRRDQPGVSEGKAGFFLHHGVF